MPKLNIQSQIKWPSQGYWIFINGVTFYTSSVPTLSCMMHGILCCCIIDRFDTHNTNNSMFYSSDFETKRRKASIMSTAVSSGLQAKREPSKFYLIHISVSCSLGRQFRLSKTSRASSVLPNISFLLTRFSEVTLSRHINTFVGSYIQRTIAEQ